MYAIIPLMPIAAYKIYTYVYEGAPLIDGLTILSLALLAAIIASAYKNYKAKEEIKRVIKARKKLAYDKSFMASYECMSDELGMLKHQTYYNTKKEVKNV